MSRATPAQVESYAGLFAGAARLGLLLGANSVPWTEVVPYVATFSERLKTYFELSVDPATGGVGLMTRGEGEAFVHLATRFMEERGIDESTLRRFLARARYFEHRNVFFKIEADTRGIQEFSYYFRRRPTLEVAHAWLDGSGVSEGARGIVDAVAEVLEKRTVHFLGTAQTRTGHIQDKVYFSQPDEPESWDRIHAVASLVGLSEADWAPLAAHRAALVGRTSFVSIGFADDRARSGMKLDVHGVDPEVVTALLGEGDAAECADLPRVACSRARHSYVGFRLVPGEPLGIKTYATDG